MINKKTYIALIMIAAVTALAIPMFATFSSATAFTGYRNADSSGPYSGDSTPLVALPIVGKGSPLGTETYAQQQKLTASDGFGSDFFGWFVAVDGDTAVVGSPGDGNFGPNTGSAYIFTRNGTMWSEQQKLTAPDGATQDFFGQGVAISGDTVVIGANLDDDRGSNSGSVYIFTRNGTTWSQQQKLTAPDGVADDEFGWSMSISGDTLLIGSVGDDDRGTNSGSAYVYTRSGGMWTLQQKLTASDGAAFDAFAYALAIDGDTAVVGAFADDDLGSSSGSAYVFVRNGTTWSQEQKLTAFDGQAGGQFGVRVGISGDTIVSGASRDGNVSGSAYVLTRTGTIWTHQQKLTASDAAANDEFGWSVSIDGEMVVIASPGDDDLGSNSGSAYVYTRNGSLWSQTQKLNASDGSSGDQFGQSVAISGNTIIVGAPLDDDAGANSGSAYVFAEGSPGCSTMVTTVNDSGAGSLREAINCANATAGTQTVSFNIPGAGLHTIAVNSPLPEITDPVIIDGYTQPGTMMNTNVAGPTNAVLLIELNGSGAGSSAHGLRINANGSVVRGLVVNRFFRNGIILISNNNTVRGSYIGTNALGDSALPNRINGIEVDGNENTIGGTDPEDRNVISGNLTDGLDIGGDQNIVQGNYIGVNADGTGGLGNGQDGIETFLGHNNIIGGTVPGARNVISSNQIRGIDLAGDQNTVQGNFIGTNSAGTGSLGNGGGSFGGEGIVVDGDNNLIGGTAPGASNVIANSFTNGITIGSSTFDVYTGNRISANSIFNNGGLGIDLEGGTEDANRVTANDPGDGDTGPNNLQNYPVLTTASSSGGVATVVGTFNSMPNTTFRLEFFSNTACDPSGFGEGEIFIGSKDETTDASGNAGINFTSFGPVAAGQFVTATATDPSGNTSEFSQCRQVMLATPSPSPTPSPADLVASKTNDLSGNEVWTRQFGTTAAEHVNDIAVDGMGNSYTVGYTEGTLPGQASSGGRDAYVRKYDAAGNEVWTRQFGTSSNDFAEAVAVDMAGNVYVAGATVGTFPGQTSSGSTGTDGYVRKYDSTGNEVWTRQFGTSANDSVIAIASDAAGNIHIAGYTEGSLPGFTNLGDRDVFVRKYDTAGNIVWTRQFGTNDTDFIHAIAEDGAGNIYVAGSTEGTLPGQTSAGAFFTDAFIRKYDTDGNIVWTRQFGTSNSDTANGIAADGAGNIYIAGSTDGTFPGQTNSGGNDALVRKYDPAGNEVWTRQFGASGSDALFGIEVDASGHSYVTGYTNSAPPGQPSPNGDDAIVRKYDASGNQIWTRQFGTSSLDIARGIGLDAAGNSYVAGYTNGALSGQTSSGGRDSFVRKYSGDATECVPWTWTITTSNQGAGPAVFAAGQTILLDELPGSGLTYDTPLVGNFSGITGLGSISASITGGVLTVTATDALTIEAGGSFIVSFTATPTANGTYDNPRSNGIAMVDPNNVIAESNEANNTFTDSVTVTGCAMEPFVDIAGQVLTSDGRGLRGATVSLTDEQGVKRSVITSSLGFYSFDDVENGTTVVIAVASKRFRFAPRTLEVTASLSDVDFVGVE